MGVLTSPLCCAVKCCGCIILSQLITLLLSIGMLVLFIATFYFFLLPWGERQIVNELGLPSGTKFDSINASTFAAQNCSGCVFGRNTQWPTNTTGSLHFLDTSAGSTISSTVATTLVATAAAGAGTMLWASAFPSMASAMSFSGGFYEMTHILEQAQYIGMMGQLQLRGSPEFLNQFSKELAWTNFNLPKSVTDKFLPSRRLALTDTVADTASAAVQPKYDGEAGPAKYAKTLGISAKDLFFYTLKVFAAVVVGIHVLYLIWIMIASCVSKKLTFAQVAAKWYRKVIWAVLLALLLGQYIFAMTGSYVIYENLRSNEPKDSHFALVCVLLVAVVGFSIIFGIAIIANNTDELKDIGTVEHDDRPFATKYSAYYDEYNFDNRFFFVPRILLAVSTGVIVGVVQNPTKQLFFLLGATFLYLLLIVIREPNLLRILYYIGLASVFMKVVLVCMMLVLVQDDYFPQKVRDKVAYAIIGVNIFIFFLLFVRQAYIIVYKIVRGCKNKGNNHSDDDDDARRLAIEEANGHGGGGGGAGANRYERLNSSGGAHGTRNNGGYQNDPYAQNQQYKEQNFMAGQQQQHPYGHGDAGMQGAAAGGYTASGQYGQHQQQQSNAPYGHQGGGARGAGMNQSGYGSDPQGAGMNHNGYAGYGADPRSASGVNQNPYGADPRGPSGMNQSSYGADPRQSNGGNQYRPETGANPAFGGQGQYGSAQNNSGANNATWARPQGRSITDRYLGIEAPAAAPESAAPQVGMSAGMAAGMAVGAAAAANARSSQQDKPEPERYTWRRNMERRAAEAAALDEASRPPRKDSLMRLESDDSYGTESRDGNSSRDMFSTMNSTNTYSNDTMDQRITSPRLRQLQQSYGTESSDWFEQRMPSEVDSYASGPGFDQSGISLAPSSANGDGDDMASSFMSVDSYDSRRPGRLADSHLSADSFADDASRSGVDRMNTLDTLAVAYLEQAGGAGATENDIGDEDDEEEDEENVAPLMDFPKPEDADDDKDETESIDIDASHDSDNDSDEDAAGDDDVDVDVDDDDNARASVDIDDEPDEDIDIDAATPRVLNTMASTSISEDSMDLDNDHNIKQLDDLRDSYMSANSTGSGGGYGFARHMSDVSLRSDDDASFYVEGRRQSDAPSAADRQKERERASGPLKL